MMTIRTLAAIAGAAATLCASPVHAAEPTGTSPVRAIAPTVSDIAACNEEAAGEKSDPTGSFVTESPDPLVHGMDPQRADDPEYCAVYRACMQARATQGR